MNNLWGNASIISAYTRKQAIADGERICLSDRYPEDCKIYRYPVFCTKRVWNLIESAVQNKDACNDFSGVIWDICYMSVHSPERKEIYGGTGYQFDVIVTGAKAEPNHVEDELPIYRLQSICGPIDIDDPSPSITISFPDED